MRPLDNPIIDKTKVITKIYGDYTLKYSSVNDVFYIVSAWHGDIKIGEASWRSTPYENGYTSRYISVIPEYQRKGIGTQLWLFAVELAEGKYVGANPPMPTVGADTTESGEHLRLFLGLDQI